MRTADALKIGMALGRISKALDAWEESKHPRADNGQFSSGGESSNKSGKSEYSKLKPHHRDDVDEVLKTAAGSNLGGTEVGANLPPKERGKVGEIRDAYKNGKMSREDAQNKIADIYQLAHEDYDNGKW